MTKDVVAQHLKLFEKIVLFDAHRVLEEAGEMAEDAGFTATLGVQGEAGEVDDKRCGQDRIATLAALVFSYLSCYHGDQWNGTAIAVAGLLLASIHLYDCWLKRSWAGPILMGACRFWNVLLGLTLVASLEGGWPFHLAAIVGIYIVGVTWFARTEARTSRRSMLRSAAVLMFAALALALPLPLWFPPGTSSVLFPYLLVALGFITGFPVVRAIAEPKPALVQAAVKRSIMGLVVLDATLATVPAGSLGLVLLLLLVPALYLGRWIYST